MSTTPNQDTPPNALDDAPSQGLEVQTFNLKSHSTETHAHEANQEFLKAAQNPRKRKKVSRKNILTKEARDRSIKGFFTEVTSFSLVAIPLAAFLYAQHHNPNENFSYYLEARFYIVPAAWFVIVYEGWKNANATGVWCAVFPPYWFYFLIAEVDNRAIRGCVSALVVILALETYWISSDAWINDKQQKFNKVVSHIHTLITRPPDPFDN